MSVKVNLLPQELAQRVAARRVAGASIASVLVFVLVLGGIYALKLSDVANARQQRDDTQAEVARLQAELASLDEFRILNERLEARSNLLAYAMGNEISWARVLNDLSLAFPADASLMTLSINAADLPVGFDPASVQVADSRTAVGGLTFTGYSIERLAPGVETVLIDFDGARGFFNTYLQTAATGAISTTDVTNFNGAIQLNGQSFTGRYADGLPSEEDQ